MPLNYKHLWESRNSAGRQDHTLGIPSPAVGPRCRHVLGMLGSLRDVGLLHPTTWPKRGWGSTCHKVFGLYSSASILPRLVILGNQATHIQLWELEAGNNGAAGNNGRSCQGELRKRHSGAGQRGLRQGTKLKVVHKSVLWQYCQEINANIWIR